MAAWMPAAPGWLTGQTFSEAEGAARRSSSSAGGEWRIGGV